MKTAIIMPHFSANVGGAERFAISVIRRLALRGHEVHVVAEDGTGTGGVKFHRARLTECADVVAGLAPDITVDWGLHVYADLHRLGGGTHQEFLRYNLLGRSWLGRFLKHLEYSLAPKHRRTICAQNSFCLAPNTHFLAVSRFAAEQLHRTVSVPRECVRIVHNGVSLVRFENGKMATFRADTRARLGLQNNMVAFLFVAHNLRLKNFGLLERISWSLSEQIPNARLIVLGKRAPKVRAPCIIYAGMTTKPEEYYAAADVLLHPTYFDACSNVVLEALAAGLPVVSSNLNGSAELIDNGYNGFVLPVTGRAAEIEKQWLTVIAQLVADASERKRISRRARELAARHSMDSYVTRFEAYLQEIAVSLGRI
jgi:UDP-glucose:(heptosyl)LPS alpha-1,3-glucosyltransferase